MVKFFVCLSMVFIFGCASSSNVVKTTSGAYNVVGYGSSDIDSRQGAIASARKYCRRIKQEVVLVNEKTTYKGLVGEEFNKTVKMASDLAWVAGQHEASSAIGASSSDQDYETRVDFRCE